MRTQYEIVTVQKAEITVDVSLLAKRDEVFFNATQMAKPFGKRPNDWLSSADAKEYIQALVALSAGNDESSITGNSGNSSAISEGTIHGLVMTKRGAKYGGTWLHTDLGIAFARWLSPMFAVRLDQWVRARIKQEHVWKQKRLEAKTGFLPMTNAVLHARDPVKHYHFSNEADLINRIVLGMSAKEFRLRQGVETVREALDAEQLAELNRLQVINTGLIEVGMGYPERKARLTECYQRGQSQNRLAA